MCPIPTTAYRTPAEDAWRPLLRWLTIDFANSRRSMILAWSSNNRPPYLRNGAARAHRGHRQPAHRTQQPITPRRRTRIPSEPIPHPESAPPRADEPPRSRSSQLRTTGTHFPIAGPHFPPSHSHIYPTGGHLHRLRPLRHDSFHDLACHAWIQSSDSATDCGCPRGQ
jgi:hypothetical protein